MSSKWKFWLIGIAIVLDILIFKWIGRYIQLNLGVTHRVENELGNN